MTRVKLWFIIALVLFFIYVAYLFVNSLERPDHIHSRDDVPQNQSGQSSQTDNSIKELETRLKTNPNDFSLLLNLGHAYMDNRQYASAAEVFAKATELKPKNAEAHVDLGNALRQDGDVNQALSILEKATKDFPEYGEGWLQLGLIYRLNLGDNRRALEYFQKFLEQDSESPIAPQVKNEIEQIKKEMGL